jgi:hypothetical protein
VAAGRFFRPPGESRERRDCCARAAAESLEAAQCRFAYYRRRIRNGAGERGYRGRRDFTESSENIRGRHTDAGVGVLQRLDERGYAAAPDRAQRDRHGNLDHGVRLAHGDE